MNKIKEFGCLWLFFLPFVAVAFGLLGYGSYCAFMGFRASYWPTTTAKIEMLDMISKRTSKRGTSPETVVTYTYSVKNKKYSNNRISFGYGLNKNDSHGRVYSKLETAKSVLVYYSPSDPQNSTLTTGFNESTIYMFLCGLFFLGCVSDFLVSSLFKPIEGQHESFSR